jgi:hypothetical protein
LHSESRKVALTGIGLLNIPDFLNQQQFSNTQILKVVETNLSYDHPVVFEQVGVAVTLLTCIREKVLGSNLGGDIGYPDGSLSGFSQSRQMPALYFN